MRVSVTTSIFLLSNSVFGLSSAKTITSVYKEAFGMELVNKCVYMEVMDNYFDKVNYNLDRMENPLMATVVVNDDIKKK